METAIFATLLLQAICLVTSAPANILSTRDKIESLTVNFPEHEGPSNILDNDVNTKYLNFDKFNCGFLITPAVGPTTVTSIVVTSADDAPERDPSTYQLYGSVDGSSFQLLSAGPLPTFKERFESVSVNINNAVAYTTYKLLFPSIIDPAKAIGMQISGVQLIGIAQHPPADAAAASPDSQRADGQAAAAQQAGAPPGKQGPPPPPPPPQAAMNARPAQAQALEAQQRLEAQRQQQMQQDIEEARRRQQALQSPGKAAVANAQPQPPTLPAAGAPPQAAAKAPASPDAGHADHHVVIPAAPGAPQRHHGSIQYQLATGQLHVGDHVPAPPGLEGEVVLGIDPGSAVMFTFLIMFGFQTGLVYWKRRNFRSFQAVTLAGLWLVPAGISLYLGFRLFVGVWSLFSLANAHFIRIATRKPLDRSTPRKVYRWFSVLHRICNFLALGGYLLLMSALFADLHIGDWHVAPAGLLLCFYGVYFGVLSRDFAEMCSDRMASVMGYYNKQGELPMRQLKANICAICDSNLLPTVRAVGRSQEEAALPAAPAERVFTLDCKHQFHEACIRGWTIVGKKDMCPYCSEKVNLSRNPLFMQPWERQNLAWAQLLDGVRYLMVWNPVIVMVCLLVFKLLPHNHPVVHYHRAAMGLAPPTAAHLIAGPH